VEEYLNSKGFVRWDTIESSIFMGDNDRFIIDVSLYGRTAEVVRCHKTEPYLNFKDFAETVDELKELID
jgi:hypothetical protein